MTDPFLPPPPPSSGGAWNAVGPYARSATVHQLRPLAALATALTVLLALAALLEVFGAWALFGRAGLLDDALNGVFISFEDATTADDRVTVAIVLHFLSFVATGVVFIIWQFRHAKNARDLGARGGLGPGWAIGGWFVPIANYVLPAMQMHQSSRASDLAGRRQGTQGRGSALVVVWAALFALASLVFSVGGGLAPADDSTTSITTLQELEDMASSDRTQAAGLALYAASAVAAIAMVRSLSARQAETHAAMALATQQALAGATKPAPTPDGEIATWTSTVPDWATQAPPRVYEPAPDPLVPPSPPAPPVAPRPPDDPPRSPPPPPPPPPA